MQILGTGKLVPPAPDSERLWEHFSRSHNTAPITRRAENQFTAVARPLNHFSSRIKYSRHSLKISDLIPVKTTATPSSLLFHSQVRSIVVESINVQRPGLLFLRQYRSNYHSRGSVVLIFLSTTTTPHPRGRLSHPDPNQHPLSPPRAATPISKFENELKPKKNLFSPKMLPKKKGEVLHAFRLQNYYYLMGDQSF